MSNGWCTIESDPAVFTEMLEKFGVEGVAVEEVISLDPSSLEQLGTLHGLVLLFKYKGSKREVNYQPESGLYFAQQIVQNACATQALINIVMNRKDDGVTLGTTLQEFFDFTSGLDPATRGEQIGQSDKIREVHNSFTRSTVFSFEDVAAKDDDDVYHFVSFIFKHGAIWELDGLQPAPILCTNATDDDWRDKMITSVQSRIAEISAQDTTGQGQGISFSLLGVVADRIPALELELALLQSEEKPTTLVEAQLEQLRQEREQGRIENSRRRHNYVPMVVALLRALAEKGKLEGIIEEVKQKKAAQAQAGGKK
ncbi:ubiquitin carboxy-terminal hydrolase, putative [Bodo saltans]|uniref:Ubiquitin carboxyl-terminal hydrolase n=1 Tax=Bodo saltans TaxID=75058 RepID=A0A0S4J7R4_BODSA|nr:ubiquitin carboxy-terminal hydrolase, putative [Bodo saltans]|eukprot:CUG87446.1 ubiquitin carboxy-terminal hydrolase, putative [Bodo saltans]